MSYKINWQIISKPIMINISGSRGSLKKYNAYCLSKKIISSCKEDMKLIIFFTGNLHSIILSQIKKDIDEQKSRECSYKQLFKYLQNKKESGKIIAIIKKFVKKFKFNEYNFQLKPIMFHYLHKGNIIDFDFKNNLKFDDYYESCILFIDKLLDEQNELVNLFREIRDLSYKEFLKKNNLVEDDINVIISTRPGHYPKADLNFFLYYNKSERIERKKRLLQSFEQPYNVEKITQIINNGDSWDTDRLVSKHDFIISNNENNYFNNYNLESDPAARLIRYAGHFNIIHDELLNIENDIKNMYEYFICLFNHYKTDKSLHQTFSTFLDLMKEDRMRIEDNLNQNGIFSILLLKGGMYGNLYGRINSAILCRLSKSDIFKIYIGSLHEINLKSALSRWDFIPDRIKDLLKILRENPKIERPEKFNTLIKNLNDVLSTNDHWRVSVWLNQIMKYQKELPSAISSLLGKIDVFNKYVLSSSQYIMLKRLKTRTEILREWNFTNQDIIEALRRAYDMKNKDDETLIIFNNDQKIYYEKMCENVNNSNKLQQKFNDEWEKLILELDEQEFVKFLLIGKASPLETHEHSLRKIVWLEILNNPLTEYKSLFTSNDISLNDIGTIINGIHGPLSPKKGNEELQLEIPLIPIEDIFYFISIIKHDIEDKLTKQ